MFIKPIPKNVLIHTCTYEKYVESGNWTGGDQFSDAIELTSVRIEYNKNYKKSANAEDNLYKAMLFFDVVNSNPKEVDFVIKSKVTFNGEEMRVVSVSPIYATNLHHYELGLI